MLVPLDFLDHACFAEHTIPFLTLRNVERLAAVSERDGKGDLMDESLVHEDVHHVFGLGNDMKNIPVDEGHDAVFGIELLVIPIAEILFRVERSNDSCIMSGLLEPVLDGDESIDFEALFTELHQSFGLWHDFSSNQNYFFV